jgi:hypothetical protein
VGSPRVDKTADRLAREQRRRQARKRTLHVIGFVSRRSSVVSAVACTRNLSICRSLQGTKQRRWFDGVRPIDLWSSTMGFASILFGGSFGLGAQLFANAIQKVPLSRSTYPYDRFAGPIDWRLIRRAHTSSLNSCFHSSARTSLYFLTCFLLPNACHVPRPNVFFFQNLGCT